MSIPFYYTTLLIHQRIMLFPGLELLTVACGGTRGPLRHDKVPVLDNGVDLGRSHSNRCCNGPSLVSLFIEPGNFDLLLESGHPPLGRVDAIMKSEKFIENKESEPCKKE